MEDKLSISELAAALKRHQAPTTPRAIRYYIQEGLLQGPGSGRGARYDRSHLDRLRLIFLLKDVWSLQIREIRDFLHRVDDETIQLLLALSPEQTEVLAGLRREQLAGLLAAPEAEMRAALALRDPDRFGRALRRIRQSARDSGTSSPAAAPASDQPSSDPERMVSALDYLKRLKEERTPPSEASPSAPSPPPVPPPAPAELHSTRSVIFGDTPLPSPSAPLPIPDEVVAERLLTLLRKLRKSGTYGTPAPGRSSEPWHRMGITDGLELSVRGATRQQIRALEEITSLLRQFLTGGTR